MKRNVLVVGGAGYIGSHVCKLLAAHDFTPVTIDHCRQGHRELVRWGPLIEVDLKNLRAGQFDHLAPVAAIHLAARIEVGESITDPRGFFRNNVAGSIALFDALPARLPVIFSSTAAVYGEPPPGTELIAETAPLEPINPYGTSKLLIERVLADLWRHQKWPSVILRYFNVIGADPDGETGEWHEPETHLLPRVLRAARAGGPVSIYGDDYPTPDGTCIRDYVDVNDLALAHLCALQWVLKSKAHEVFNVGYSRGISVMQMLEAVEAACAVTLERRIGPRRAGDPAVLVADGRRARKILEWSPTFAGRLDQSVRHAFAWDGRILERQK